MDSLFFSNDDDVLPSASFSDPGQSIFLVPFRWWKEAACGGGFDGVNGVGGVLYDSTVRLSSVGMGDSCNEEKVNGDSEIFVGMRREEEALVSGEEGVSSADLAFVSEWMFFTALKWHCDKEDVESLLHRDGLLSLKIRLMYMRESRHLVIKIRQKDNEVGIFNRAYSIFGTKSGSLHIWDLSGQTHQLFVGDNKSSVDKGQPDEEVRIELQIYGLPYTINDEDRHKQTTGVEKSWIGDPSSSSPLRTNDNVDELDLCLGVMPAAGCVTHRTGALDMTGSNNTGNTRFMNSAIQSLVHTPKHVEYFLGNFRRYLNFENPLGMNGQDRSTLVCPVCKKLSTTFDPFMYLLLPLPSSNLREMTLTVLSTDGTTLPRQVTIRVPGKGTFKDLVEALGRGCSLRDDETLLVAEVFGSSIRHLFDDPNASIDLVLSYHQLVAYRFPKATEGSQLVEFIHLRRDESFEMFGIPLVARISDFSNGLKIREKFLNLVNPFLRSGFTDDLPDFKFYFLLDNDCFFESTEIEMDEPVDYVSPQTGQCIKVLVSWPYEMSKRHDDDTSYLSFLPVVCETKTDTSWTHDSISLYNCMDAFLKEEPLGPDDTWKIVMYDKILSLCLDGLHEDLNRVKIKVCIQAEDKGGCPQEEVADKYWKNHLSCNNSIIVDLCQGQYRSTLVCPVCENQSTTFDPFMYLSLPLPSNFREMTLTFLRTDGTTLPRQVTIRVPDKGTFKDIVRVLGRCCSLRDDEALLIAEVFCSSIRQVFDDPNASIDLVLGHHKLVAYRLPKAMEGSQLVEFIHLRQDESYEMFGIPLVARISDFSNGSKIREKFLNLMNPFLRPRFTGDLPDFKFYLLDNDCFFKSTKIEMDEPVDDVSPQTGQCIKILVSWPHETIKRHYTLIPSYLPVVCRAKTVTHKSTSLYNCMDAFLKEEPFGTWYCPNCKKHTQARKKLGLWRLPEILVIHLKRFLYRGQKLETFVDFPFDAFDLSGYINQENNTVCNRYKLYAVSNHYGGMDGGHYTAFAKHRFDKWYEFDDSHAVEVNEDKIKSKAASVLFYRRI